MLKLRGKNAVIKAFSATLTAVMMTTLVAPELNVIRVMAAERNNQFNVNMAGITEQKELQLVLTEGPNVNKSSGSIKFTGNDSAANFDLEFNDNYLIDAIDSGVKVPFAYKFEGVLSSLPEGGSVDLNVDVRFGKEGEYAEDNAPISKTIHIEENGSFSISDSIDIPKETRSAFVSITPTFVDADGSILEVKSSEVKVVDDARPQISYEAEITKPTNTEYTVKVIAEDNIGVQGIYDKEGNLVSDKTGKKVTFDITINNDDSVTYEFYAIDYAGHATLKNLVFTIDNYDSKTPGDFSGSVSTSDWTNVAPVITLDEIQQDSGSTIKYYVKEGDLAESPIDGNTYTIKNEGISTVVVTIGDEAGNRNANTKSFSYQYDKTAPEVTSQPIAQNDGTTKVLINANDTLSGVDKVYYVLDKVLESDFTQDKLSEFTEITAAEKSFIMDKAGDYTIYVVDVAGNYKIVNGAATVKPVIFPTEDIKKVDGKDTFTMKEDKDDGKDTFKLTISDDSAPEDLKVTAAFDSSYDDIIDSIDITNSDKTYSFKVNPKDDKFHEAGIPVTITVEDPDKNKESIVIFVVIEPVNDPPRIVVDGKTHTVKTEENKEVSFNPTTDSFGKDYDVEGDDIVVSSDLKLSNESAGKLTLDGNEFKFVPTTNWYGKVTFTYTVTDGKSDPVEGKYEIEVTNINDKPIAKNDSAETDEDKEISINVLKNDSDPDMIPGSTEKIRISAVDGKDISVGETVTLSSGNGKVTLKENGELLVTPTADFNGIITFTYKISDIEGASDTATVTVKVDAVDDAPEIVEYPKDTKIPDQTMPEDPKESEKLKLTFTVKDIDTKITDLVINVSSSDGNLIKNDKIQVIRDSEHPEKITVIAEPVKDENGKCELSIKVSDGINTIEKIVKVTVDPRNDDPVATPDDMTKVWNVFEGQPFDIAKRFEAILANDSDIDNDNIFVSDIDVVTSGAGSVSVTKDTSGKVTKAEFTSPSGFTGNVVLTYTISDGNGGKASSTITIHVEDVDDAPVIKYAGTTEALTIDEDDEDKPIEFVISDSDTDVEKLTVVYESSNPQLITNAHISSDGIVKIDENTGKLVLLLTPTAQKSGETEIKLTVSDGTSSTSFTQKVTVRPVQDPPVAEDDRYDRIYGGTGIYFIPTSNDHDLDDEPLSVAKDGQGKYRIDTPSIGSIVPYGDGIGFVYFAPSDVQEDGTEVKVKYYVTDGKDTDDAEITFVLYKRPENLPVIKCADPFSFRYNETAPEHVFKVEKIDSANHKGSVSVAFTSLVDLDGDGVAESNAILESISAKRNNDGTFSLIPKVRKGVTGGRTVVEITANNGQYFTRQYITVFVHDKNEIPTIVDHTYNMENEGQKFTITKEMLLEGAEDKNKDPISLYNLSISSCKSSLAEVTVIKDPATGEITGYQFDPHYSYFYGTVTLTYTVTDGIDVSTPKTVTLVYPNKDSKPVARADSFVANLNEPGGSGSISVASMLSNDYDVDNDFGTEFDAATKAKIYFITYSDRTTESGRLSAADYGTLTYDSSKQIFTYVRDQKVNNAHGDVYFDYWISNNPDPRDENGNIDYSQCVKSTVHIYESYPRLWLGHAVGYATKEDNDYTNTISIGHQDYDGPVRVTYTITNGTSDIGEFKYTEILEGTYSSKFTFDVNDNANGTVKFTISVEAVKKDEQGNWVTDTDVEGAMRSDSIYVVPVNDIPNLELVDAKDDKNQTQPTGEVGKAEPWEIDEDGSMVFTFVYDDIETDPLDLDFTAVVKNFDFDGEKTDEPVVTVGNISISKQEFTDESGTHCRATVTMPTISNMSGLVEITFTVSDGEAKKQIVTKGIVNPVDDPPEIKDIEVTTEEDTEILINLAEVVYDVDTEAKDLVYYVTVDPENGEIISFDQEKGNLTYRPNTNYYGTDTFKFAVGYVADKNKADSEKYKSVATVTVNVTPVNDDPIVYDWSIRAVGKEDEVLKIPFKCTDPEDKNLNYEFKNYDKNLIESLEVVKDSSPNAGANDYILVVTPKLDKHGSTDITLVVTDNNQPEAGKTEKKLSVVFNSENDVPKLENDTATLKEKTPTQNSSVEIEVLNNDSDVETAKNNLIISVNKTPASGAKIQVIKKTNAPDTILYTPLLNWNGTESFEYNVIDEDGGVSTAIVTVTVEPVNTYPTIINHEKTIDERSSCEIDPLVGAVDVEVNGGGSYDENQKLELIPSSVEIVTEGGAYGTVKVENGKIIYTETEEVGAEPKVEKIKYNVTDGLNSAEKDAYIYITILPISDPPKGLDPEKSDSEISIAKTEWVLNEDPENPAEESTFYIKLDDPDTDLSKLIVTIKLSDTTIIKSSGVKIENYYAEDGKLLGKKVTLVPIENQNGELSATIVISDGTSAAEYEVPIIVNPINDKPEFTDKTKETVLEGVQEYETNEEVAVSDTYSATDVEDKTEDLIFSVSKQPNAAAGSVTIDANGKWTFTPKANFHGTATFTLRVTDKAETNKNNPDLKDATVKYDEIEVSVKVNNLNDAPVAKPIEIIVDESSTDNVIDLKNLKDPNGNYYFSDPDISTPGETTDAVTGEELTISRVGFKDTAYVTKDSSVVSAEGKEDNGFSRNGSATISGFKILYTPALYDNHEETFTYEIKDKEGKTSISTIHVTIVAKDDKPSDGDDTYDISEDCGWKAYDVLVNDNDPDILDKYTQQQYRQTLLLKYVTYGGKTIYADQPVEILKTAHGEVKIENGTLYYRPDENFYNLKGNTYTKNEVFTYGMTDTFGGNELNSVEFDVEFKVKSVNDIPTITTVGTSAGVDEGEKVIINGTVDDVETPKTGTDGLKVTAISSNKHLVPDAAISVSGPNADGTYSVTCTPTAHANGETTITLTVDDREGGKAKTTFKIIVREVDDIPDPDVQEDETDENTPKIVDVLLKDDPDLIYGSGDKNLTIVDGSVKAPANFTGTFEVIDYTTVDKYYDKDGNYVDRPEPVTRKAIKITPDSDWTSSEDVTYEFTYEAIDNNNEKKPGILKFTVKAVNDAPVFGDRLDTTKNKSEAINSEFAKAGAIYEDMESETSTPLSPVICSDPNGVAVYTIYVDDEETPVNDLSVSIVSISPNESSTKELLLDKDKTKILQNDDGTWTLYAVPVKDQNGGQAKVNLSVTDGEKSSAYSVIVKVNPKDDAPSDGDDDYQIAEDSGEHKFEVTVNDDIDSTTNNEGLKVISVIPGANAHAKTLKIDPTNDKVIIYEPEQDYFNDKEHKATFQYVVEDEAGYQRTFTVSVEVTPKNDPPKIEVIANNAGKISTVERTPFAEFTVIVSDVDDPAVKGADAKGILVLTATNEGAKSLIRNDAIKISDPVAEMEDGQPTGRYIYKVNITPNKAYNGETTIKFTVKDPSKASSSKSILANVGFKNDAPYFFDGKAKVDMVFDEGPNKRIIDVSNCYYDEDLDTNPMSSANPKGEQLYISSWEFTEAWMNTVGSLYIVDKNGNEVTSANKIDGVKLAYKPNAGFEDFNGIIKFKYTVSDTIGSPEKMDTEQYSVTSDVCSITINQVNDPPKVENYTSTVNEDDTNIVLKKADDTVIKIAADNTDADFYDIEVDGIKVNQDHRSPYDKDEKLTITKIVGNKGGTAIYDAANDEVIYTPKAHFNGIEILTFTVEDSHGGKTTGTIKVTVVSKNDAPVAKDDEVTIIENEQTSIDVIKGVPEATGKDTEPYDSDTSLNEGQSAAEKSNNTTLTVVGVYQTEAEATAAAVDSNSTFQENFTTTHSGKVEIKNNQVSYLPGKDYNGDDVIYYVVANKNANENKYSVAKIDIHVTAVNNKPVITDSESNTDENTNIAIPSILEDHDAIVVNIFDSDSFVDGNKPDTSAVNFTGNKTVRISDQDRYYDNNLLPEATNDDVRFQFAIESVEAIKPDGSVKTVDTITSAYYLSLLKVDKVTGIMTFTPGKDFNGTLKFKYSVSDGTDKAYGYVTFTVISVNDNPVANDDSVETPEDKAIKIDVVAGMPASTGKDTDIDSSEILNLGETDEVKNQNSTIKVVGVYQTEAEAVAKAVDSNSSFSTEFETTHSGTVKITGDHEVTYTPAANYNGSDEFYYVIGNVAAGENKYAVAKVSVTVKASNDAPIIRDVTKVPNLENEKTEVKVNVFDEDKGPVTVNIFNQETLVGANKTTTTDLYGTDKKVNIVDYDRQMDNALLVDAATNNVQFKFAKVSVEAFDANGDKVTTNNAKYLGYLAVDSATGDMTLTPDANFNGTLKYKYSVSDGTATVYGYVTFEVKSVNDAPVANADQAETKEDAEAIAIDVLKNDKDVDRDYPELNLGQSGTVNTDLKVLAVFKTEQEAKDAFADNKIPANTGCEAVYGGTVVTDGTKVTYKPAANFNGVDEFYYVVGNKDAGADKSNEEVSIAKVTVLVLSVNDAPIAVADSAETDEDNSVTIDVINGDTEGNGKDTEPNDGDNDINKNQQASDKNTELTVVAVYKTEQEAKEAVNKAIADAKDNNKTKLSLDNKTCKTANGATITISANKVVYKPADNFNGNDEFYYVVANKDSAENNFSLNSIAKVEVKVNSVNDAPDAKADKYNEADRFKTEDCYAITTEDQETPIEIDVLKNDEDVDTKDALNAGQNAIAGEKTKNTSFTIVGVYKTEAEAKSALNSTTTECKSEFDGTVKTDGTKVTYVPAADFNGEDTFYYVVANSSATTGEKCDTGSIAKVTVFVRSVNDAPVANDDKATTAEDTPVTIDVIGNAAGADKDPIDSVEATNKGQQAAGDTVNTELTVIAVYSSRSEAETAVTNAINGNTSLSKTSCTTKSGSVTIVGNAKNNQVQYTPKANFNGTDKFYYVVANKGAKANEFSLDSIAEVVVTVKASNDAPIIRDVTKVPNLENEKTEVKVNVFEEDKGPVTVNIFNQETLVGANKTTKTDLYGTDKKVNIVDYDRQMDNALLVDAATNNVQFKFAKVSVEAFDANGDKVTTNNAKYLGYLVVDSATGDMTLTPDANFNGTLKYKYSVSDGTATVYGYVTFEVKSVNDAPVANDDKAETPEDKFVVIDVIGGTTTGAVKDEEPADGDATLNLGQTGTANTDLTVVGVYASEEEAKEAAKGTQFANSFTTEKGGKVEISGNQIKYTPKKDFHGDDYFYYVVGNTAAAENKYSVARVDVKVAPVNDQPVFDSTTPKSAEMNETNENTPADKQYLTIDIGSHASDVDTSTVGDTLKFTIDGQDVASAGRYEASIDANGVLKFKPVNGFNGIVNLTIKVDDQQGKANSTNTTVVKITVKSVNNAPVANDDKAETPEDKFVVIDVIGGTTTGAVKDEEPADGDATLNLGQTGTANTDLTLVGVYASEEEAKEAAKGTAFADSFTTEKGGKVEISGNQVKYTPKKDFHGDDYLYYVVGNTAAAENKYSVARVDVKVTPENDQPVFDSTTPKSAEMSETNEDTPADKQYLTIDIGSHASDVDTSTVGDKLKFTIDGQDVTSAGRYEASIDANGVLKFKPLNGFNGVVNLTIKVDDQQGKANSTNTTVVKITVKSVNNAPVANDDKAETDEEQAVTIDVIGGTTTGAVKDEEPVDGDATLNLGQTGTANTDLTVVGVYASEEEAKEAAKGTAFADSFTTEKGGKVEISGNKVKYTPKKDFHGDDYFYYVVGNTAAAENKYSVARVDVKVAPVNDQPVFDSTTPKSAEMNETNENTPADKQSLTIDIGSHASDVDTSTMGDTLKFSISGQDVASEGHYEASIDANGVLKFKPLNGFNGVVNLTIKVDDQQGKANSTNTTVVKITVKSVNNAPVANDDTAETTEDSGFITIDVIGGSPASANADKDDVDGDTTLNLGQTGTANTDMTVIAVFKTYELAKQAVESGILLADEPTSLMNGEIGIVGSGPNNKVQYKPAANFYGEDSFWYVIANVGAGENQLSLDSIAQVKLTVSPKNDAPIFLDKNGNKVAKPEVTVSAIDEGSEKIVVNIFDPASFVDEDKPDTSSVNKNVADKLTIVDYDRHHDNALIPDDQKFTFDIKSVTVIDTNGNEKTSVDPAFIAEYMTYISIGEKTGIITFNPDENFNGTLKYEFSVSDQVEESTGYVIFTVNSKNDAPVAVDDKASVDEDKDVDIDVIGGTTAGAVADTDEFDTSDKLGQGQSADVKKKNTEITIVGVYASEDDAKKAVDDGSFATENDTAFGHISTDGKTVNYKPVDNFNGSETFYYVIANKDASENKYSYDSIGKVEVTVDAKDDAPDAGEDSATTLQDEAVTIPVLDNDEDIDSDDDLNKNPDKTPLFVVENGFEGLEAGATASVDADGNVLYTPAPGFYGKDVFTYTVSDSNGNTSKGEVTVTVIKSDYSILAEPDKDSFGSIRAEDEDVPAPITITVTNVGNKPVDVTEPSLDNYEIDGTFPTSLNPAESFTFTIVPKKGLPIGDYSDDLEINTVQGTNAIVPIDYQVLDLYTLTSKVTTKGGKASFVGTMDIAGSETYEITFKPNKGYRVKAVIVNGVSVGRVSKYEIVNPTMSYTIEVKFERKPGNLPSTGETTDWGRNALAVFLILGSAVLLKARKKNEEEEN